MSGFCCWCLGVGSAIWKCNVVICFMEVISRHQLFSSRTWIVAQSLRKLILNKVFSADWQKRQDCNTISTASVTLSQWFFTGGCLLCVVTKRITCKALAFKARCTIYWFSFLSRQLWLELLKEEEDCTEIKPLSTITNQNSISSPFTKKNQSQD